MKKIRLKMTINEEKKTENNQPIAAMAKRKQDSVKQ